MASDRLEPRIAVLRRVALFDGLDADTLGAIASRCGEIGLDKDDVVCRAGEMSDRLLIVTSGEVEVWGGADQTTLLNRLGPGEVVGELGLLLAGGTRSATVVVARAARFLVIDRDVFDQFVRQDPAVLARLAVTLARRLAPLARGESPGRATTTLAVVAAEGLQGKSLVAGALAALLRRQTASDVLLVQLHGVDDPAGRDGVLPDLATLVGDPVAELEPHVRTDGPLGARLALAIRGDGDASIAERLSALTARLGRRFPLIVFDTCGALGPRARVVASACHHVLEIVTDAGLVSPPWARDVRRAPFQILNLRNPGCSRPAISHCEPFVLLDTPAFQGLDLATQVARIVDGDHEPMAVPLGRLARKILGASVGIALGGGASFGLAHIGVLQVLEESGIPVDVVAGTSFGAIVGMGYAAGLGPAELGAIARRVGTRRNALLSVLDLTPTGPALFSGERTAALFAELRGSAATFEDLLRPCRVVAADVETGERVALGSGSIAGAHRASAAVPVIWAPVRLGERVLIDGSMVDPVPADVVQQMGADICVAVNVVPRLKKGVETSASRWYRRVNRLNPLAYLGRRRDLPNLFDVWMNTIQMVQRELGGYKAIPADVVINPDLSEFTWTEFYRADEIIARGRAAAEDALPGIRRVLAERLQRR